MSDLKSAVYSFNEDGPVDEAFRYVNEAEGHKISGNIDKACRSYNQASQAYLVAYSKKRQSVNGKGNETDELAIDTLKALADDYRR